MHHSLMSSIHSILGLPCHPFPCIIPNITLFVFLLSSILHIGPNRPSFLYLTVYIRRALIFSLSRTTLLVTFIVQFRCNILTIRVIIIILSYLVLDAMDG